MKAKAVRPSFSVPKHIQQLSPYVPGKPVEHLQRELGVASAIKLASNENPLGCSATVRLAIEKAIDELNRYPDSQAHRLRAKLAKVLSIDENMLVFGSGSNELIDVVIRTFCDPGTQDEIVIGNPSFVYYRIGAGAAKIKLKEVPLRNHITWSVDDLLESTSDDTRMMIISNPNNPTGSHIDADGLKQLVLGLPEHVMLIMDEAYIEYCDRSFKSAIKLLDARANMVILRTFSKAYGLAGIRAGFAVTHAPHADFMQRVRLPFNLSTLAQVAASAALDDAQHLERVVALNTIERERVAHELTALGYEVAPSQGNFVLVGPVDDAGKLYQDLLMKGVIVRPMPEPIRNYLRISIGSENENTLFLTTLKAI